MNETESQIAQTIIEALELKRKRSPRHPPLVH